jgi:hypothetical protein
MAVFLVSYDAVQQRGWHQNASYREAKKGVQENIILINIFICVEQSETKLIIKW